MMRLAVHVMMPVIVPRAMLIWVLVRLVGAALPLAGGAPFGSMPPAPIAVILLCGLAGLIDIRVRGERLLWANLGVPSMALSTAYSATAVPAEFLLLLIAR